MAAHAAAGTLGSVLALGAGGLVFATLGLPLVWGLGDASTRDALAGLARRLRRRRGR